MTIFIAPRSRVRARTRWVEARRGLHVANRRGEYLGYVAATPLGAWVAFDSRSAQVGSYDTLVEAKAAFSAGASRQRGPRILMLLESLVGTPSLR